MCAISILSSAELLMHSPFNTAFMKKMPNRIIFGTKFKSLGIK